MIFNNNTQNQYNKKAKRFTGNLHRIVFWVIMGVVIAVVFAFVFGIAVKFLWAATLSSIFGIKEITYWQAVGIVILARLIFGGFGYRSKNSNNNFGRHDKKFRQKNQSWKKIHDHFHGFSDDEETTSEDLILPENEQKHYKDFWKREGKKAFENYLSKRENDSQ